MTFGMMTLRKMTFRIMTLRIMTFGIMTLRIMTFSIVTFGIMTFGIKHKHSLIFVIKAGAYTGGAPERRYTLGQAPDLTHKY